MQRDTSALLPGKDGALRSRFKLRTKCPFDKANNTDFEARPQQRETWRSFGNRTNTAHPQPKGGGAGSHLPTCVPRATLCPSIISSAVVARLLTIPPTTQPQQHFENHIHTHTPTTTTTTKSIHQSIWAAAETPDAPVPAAAVLLAPALAAYVIIAYCSQSHQRRILTLQSQK